MDSTLVIKVKYGDTLRRFNARVDETGELDLDMGDLKEKILGLFNFPPEAELSLTYIDEDGDVVTLIDDADLCDVMSQRLKFLRIDVQTSSENSTPLRTPRVQPDLSDFNIGAAEVLKAIPEPLREAISKSLDLASAATSSYPVVGDYVDLFFKGGAIFSQSSFSNSF
jgi:next-to-BRCA1 protein 1